MQTAYATGSKTTPYGMRILSAIREPGSAITHFLGFLFALLMCPVLLLHASANGATAAVLLPLAAFMVSTMLLYAASTAYHGLRLSARGCLWLKKWDHCMIPVLITGTYTPVCLLAIGDREGRLLLAGVAALSALSILFKLFWVTCPRWVSSVLYLALGWMCLLMLPSLLRVLSPGAFSLLLSGGLLYSAGAVIYALKAGDFNKRHPYFGTHEIFHLFVMGGNLCHFLLMFLYLS